MKTKTAAIITARMNSSRLHGKVLMDLTHGSDLCSLKIMIKRVSRSKYIDEVIIATTDNILNDPIESFSKSCELPHKLFRYKGLEDDVIGRVYATAIANNVETIVDLTGDCPLVDHRHIDNMFRLFMLNETISYISNCVKRSWPDGLDIQIYPTFILKECIDIYNPRQHSGWNISQHPTHFNILHYPPSEEYYWPELGLTLDTPEDYEMLKFLFQFLSPITNSAEEFVDYLRLNPEFITNKNVKRKSPDEG